METGDEFGFCLRQVERHTVGFSKRRDQEHDEADKLRNDEPFEGEYTRGTVAMANAGPNTNGSQFFIMHQDYALPKNYVIFGKVAQGLDVVDKIAESPVVMSDSGEPSKPVNPVAVKSVEVLEQ